MTIAETSGYFAASAEARWRQLRRDPIGFVILAMMAGAYVGVGILLIFAVGQPADPSWRSLVMGASFGIALTLVVFAGSELFTGHAMYAAHGLLGRRIGLRATASLWAASWGGNLAGAMLLAAIFVAGGGGAVLAPGPDSLLDAIALKKMHSGPVELIARGMLCNWLVCLAIWTAARTKDDTAKCILILWCLFAFIASGFEHSLANMTIFSVALMAEHAPELSLGGAAHNLLWVTLGNLISGFLVMGLGYWRAGRPLATPSGMNEERAAAE